MNQRLTAEQLDQMRELLKQHDAEQSSIGKVREFDLNNPPKEPYTYQEFPKMVYHHEKRHHHIVKHEDALNEALEQGYVEEPFPAEEAPVAVSEKQSTKRK